MKSISQFFLQRCKTELTQIGFVRDKSTYARIVGDVLQSLTFKCFRSGRECTVEFGIVPLCLKPEWPGMGTYDLSKYDVEHYGGWKFDNKSEASIDCCVARIMTMIEKELIPLFQRTRSCEAALYELIKLDEIFEANRQEVLRRKNYSDKAEPFEQNCFVMPEKCYMALKANDFSIAEKCLTIQIRTQEEILLREKNMLNNTGDSDWGSFLKSRIPRREEKLEFMRNILSQVQRQDISRFRKEMEQNEEYSRQALKKFIIQ